MSHNIPRTPEEYRHWWHEQRPDIPYGYCWCGCGEKTNTAKYTSNRYLKGEPHRFIKTHGGREANRTNLHPGYTQEDRGFSSPCWIWKGARGKGGYCKTHSEGRLHQTHRLFYEQVRGPIPENLQLDHLCRITNCVNPAHLEPVTPAENTRRGKGTKLTLEDVNTIRLLVARKTVTQRRLATMYGVHEQLIHQIVRRKVWRD